MEWHIIENNQVDCPGFNPDVLPEQIPEKLHVLHGKNGFELLADGIAGVIPCREEHSIVIVPKCNTLNPFSMYGYVNNLSLESINTVLTGESDTRIGIQMLSRMFVDELLQIQCKQRIIARPPIKLRASSVIGHVDWPKTEVNTLRGKQGQIETTRRLQTTDTIENQIISSAAQCILPLFSPDSSEYNILCVWGEMRYGKKLSYRSAVSVKERVASNRFSGAHAYYQNAIKLALMILGIDEAWATHNQTDAILFNMPGLYEDYIRTAFMRKGSIKGLSCQKGFIPKGFLFSDGSCELEPDITIYQGANIKAVMDVKYKVPDSKDYYQLFTYMTYAGLQTAFVISPSVKHLERITAFDGRHIVKIRIDHSNNTKLESIAESVLSM